MKRPDALAFAAFLREETTQDICFACHVSPDGDTLGSAFALVRICRALGKRAFVYVPEPIPKHYRFLEAETENKPFEPKVVVTVDVSAPHRLGDLPHADRIAYVVDHHRNNAVACDRRFIRDDAAATGLLIYDTALCLDLTIDPALARALYTAISTDTGCFRHSNTTPDVFKVASELAKSVPEQNFADLNRTLFVLKPQSLLRLEAYVLSHAVLDEEHSLVYFCLTERLKKRFRMTDHDADFSSLIDAIRAYEGFDVYCVARQCGKRRYKLSLRADSGNVDVCAVCAKFGGGGHTRAAGCTMEGAKNEIYKNLCAALTRNK